MADVVSLVSHREINTAVIDILEEALAKAKSGELVDVAVVSVIRDDDGPQFWANYYGERQYAALCAGVSALMFDLHYHREKMREGRA